MAYAAGLRGILPVHTAICQSNISIYTQLDLAGKIYVPARVQFDVVADVVSERLLELECGGHSERLG